MTKLLELYEKRNKAVAAARAFLDSKRGDSDILSAEDEATYNKMEADILALGREIDRQTFVDQITALPEGTRIQLLAPVVRRRKGEHQKVFEEARKNGYVRARVNGEIRELSEDIKLEKTYRHSIEIVVPR